MKKFILILSLILAQNKNVLILAQEYSLEWAKSFGGSGTDYATCLVTDLSGNVYVTGYFTGTADFDPGPGTLNLGAVGNEDIFILKLDPNGDLIWAKAVGGSNFDGGNSLAVDDFGNVYITGYFQGNVDFNPGPLIFNLSSYGGAEDVFILKLDPSGEFNWVKQIGGNGIDRAHSIALSPSGIYINGYFNGNSDFDPSASDFNMISVGSSDDIFLCKLDFSGNFLWAKQTGGNSVDRGLSLTTDSDGNVLSTGFFNGTADFDPSALSLNMTSFGSDDIFIQKFDELGNLIWAKQLGGTTSDKSNSIKTDELNNVITTGYFTGTADFDPSAINLNLVSAGSSDQFICKLDQAGNLIWAQQFSGSGEEVGYGVSIDTEGNIYTTGYMNGTVDFDPGAGILPVSANGLDDAFIMKLNSLGNIVWATNLGGSSYDYAYSIDVDENLNIHTAGHYHTTVDFDPLATSFNLSTVGQNDLFTLKWNQCPSTYSSINESACDNFISPSGLYTYNASGVYKDTIVNFSGCDSIITINLVINNSNNIIENIAECDTYTWPVNGQTYTTSGVYTENFTNMEGCDSIRTLNLTINYSKSSYQYVTGCGGYTWSEDLNLYTTSGTYSVNYSTSQGCDSIIYLVLSIGSATTISFNFPANEYCLNTPPLLLNNFVTPLGGAWSGPGVNSLGYFNAAQAGTGIHTLTYTYSDGGCVSSANFIITVLSNPSVSVISESSACELSSGAADATITGGTAPFDIYWSNGAVVEDISDLSPGMYFVNVIDSKGCIGTGSAMIEADGLSISGIQTNPDCFGNNSGSIDLSIISSAGIQSINWSNGATSEDLLNIGSGTYEVLVTDNNNCVTPALFEVTAPDPIAVSFVSAVADCGLNNGSLTASVNGGTAPYNYQWYVAETMTPIGSNDPTLSSLFAGAYVLVLTDNSGCSAANLTSVSNSNSPEIIINSVTPAGCSNNGAIDISISSAELISSILWSNGAITEDISSLVSDNYSVSVQDDAGCIAIEEVFVPQETPLVIPVCLVTVDTLTNTNLLVWEKPLSIDIDHFKIYRETSVAGQFMLIDSVDYANESIYNDVTAFPHIRSWRYKISTVSACGSESDLSEFHKTIHLTISLGLGGNINLNWDDYQGFMFGTYDIYRHTNPGGWELIQSLPSSNFSYTDNPSTMNGLDYIISVTPPDVCSSTNKGQDHNSSRSNKTSSITGDLVGVDELNLSGITRVFPNPSSMQFNILVDTDEINNFDYVITDAQGRIVMQNSVSNSSVLIDLSTFSDGIYNLQLLVGDQVMNHKLVKQ